MAWICPVCESVVGRGKSVTAKCCRKCGAILVSPRRLAQILDETMSEGMTIIPLLGRLRVYPLRDLGIHTVVDPATRSSLVYGSINLILKRTRSFLASEIDEFEALINMPGLKESQLQTFFELHPNFLLGTDYESLRSNIILPNHPANDLIPDFFLEPVVGESWDIVELKLPDKPLAVGRVDRKKLSHYVHEGCVQLRTYMDYFDDSAHRDAAYQKYGIRAYRPRLALIIGRKREVSELVWKRLELNVPYVQVVTYDDLLAKARTRILM